MFNSRLAVVIEQRNRTCLPVFQIRYCFQRISLKPVRDTPTEGIADARDFELRPNGVDEPSRFNTESLLAEIGLSGQAVREIQASRSALPASI